MLADGDWLMVQCKSNVGVLCANYFSSPNAHFVVNVLVLHPFQFVTDVCGALLSEFDVERRRVRFIAFHRYLALIFDHFPSFISIISIFSLTSPLSYLSLSPASFGVTPWSSSFLLEPHV